jgi:exopolyphosphatase / guanosine-5'-triphosphate,3'-diphosphate pyrophosphatase
MRAATIDIGTNTVLLLVAERGADGTLSALAERATITRLGEGVDKTRRLKPEAVARTHECLEQYAAVVANFGVDRVAVVGTSAMRDAAGGDAVTSRVRALFGVDARVVSGEAEARLTFRGSLSGLPIAAGNEAAVFDIGGGSTEVVLARRGATILRYAESFDVGSVRLTERCIAHDPPARAEVDAIQATLAKALGGVPPLAPGVVPVGVAGTVTTLAAVAQGLVPYDGARAHGSVLSRARLGEVVASLSSVDVDARRKVPGMEPKRADVIVAGGLIVLALLDHWGAEALRVSDRGVRWGLAEELLGPAGLAPA